MKYWCLLLLLLSCFFAFGAEPEEYRFSTFSPRGGLNTDGIKSICQDQQGFVWIVVADEIFRFDGFNYKRYSGKLQGLNTEQPSINFRSVYEDSNGNLYLGTSSGLFIYHRGKDSFSLLYDKHVTQIVEDHYGDLWLADNEIGIYNRDKRSFSNFYYEDKLNKSYYNNVLFADTLGNVFLSSDFGKISVVAGKSRETTALYAFPEGTRISALYRKDDHLWILTETTGLFVLDIENKEIVKKYDFFLHEKNNKVPAKCLLADRSGNMWIGTQQGLYILHTESGRVRRFLQESDNPYSIVNNSIWTITEDNQGDIWIGTYSGGLNYLSQSDRNVFNTVSLTHYGFTQKAVSSFAKIGQDIWFGTEGGGLYCYQKEKGTIQSYSHDPVKNSLKYYNVKTLLRQDHYLWIGMFRGGIDRLDLRTGHFDNFNEKSPDKRIFSDEVMKIEAEGDSGMWVIYQRGGTMLTYFSFQEEVSQHYFLEIPNGDSSYNRMVDICRDDQGHVWLASSNCIFMFDSQRRECERTIELAHKVQTNRPLSIKTIYYDSKHSALWIGTQSHGLIRYNVRDGQFRSYDSILKFGYASVNSIVGDKEGNLWIGSEVGLFKYDMEQETLQHYDKNDGIQSTVFYPRSVYTDSEGFIYLGGTEGFNYFDPERIVLNEFKPQVLLVNLLVNNRYLSEDPDSEDHFVFMDEDGIELDYKQNSIGIELSSTNYLLPMKNRYRYRLKGYDDEWTEVDASRRHVSYPKLPSGKYVFEAMAGNNDGVWGELRRFTIEISPAPWNSIWAYLLYFMLIFLLLYYFYREKIRRDKLKNEVYLAACRKKDQEENHQGQLSFFTNITHDFKTPLTIILGTLDRIEEEEHKIPSFYLDALKSNSSRLFRLVNEVIDFRTVEKGMMKIRPRDIDMNQFLHTCVSDMREYAYHKDIKLKVHTDPEFPHHILFDPNILEKILVNLLDNAIKYTLNGGLVVFETYRDIRKFRSTHPYTHIEGNTESDEPMCGFVIRDSGVGISEQSISKVFKRFYRVEDYDDDPHLGSGIGLALVRSLVLFCNGMISISSERGVGTEMVVGFPLKELEVEGLDSDKGELADREVVIATEDLEDSTVDFSALQLSQQYTILYVEDNEEIRQMVSSFLRSNFDVTTASNGEEAWSILQTKSFDLILSDWMMPLLDGVGLCRQVKQNSKYAHIPFVLMTVRSGMENQLEGFGSGAEAYLEKPVNFKLLIGTICNLLRLRENFRTYYADNYFIDTSSSTMNKEMNQQLEKFLEIVQQKIHTGEVDFDKIAEEMGMSRRKLYSFVNEHTGKSIVEFVRTCRVRLAGKLMVEEKLSVKEAMMRVGIESQSYFSKTFKNEFGETPSAFMTKMRNKNRLGS